MKLLAIEHGDGVLHVLLVFHFNEGKSLGSARVAVFDQSHGLDCASFCKQGLQVGLVGGVGQITDVEFVFHFLSWS